MKNEGGCEWYQSIGLTFLNISANFLLLFKGHLPFKDIVQPKNRGVKRGTNRFISTSYTIADVF